MSYSNSDIVQKAIRKMKTQVVKLSLGLQLFIFAFIFLSVLLLFYFAPVLQEYVVDLGTLVAYLSSTSFFLLMLKVERTTNNRWRFWVLKEVHYLQDFITIRKMAEQKKYVRFNENWLTKKYIKKRTTGKLQKELRNYSGIQKCIVKQNQAIFLFKRGRLNKCYHCCKRPRLQQKYLNT